MSLNANTRLGPYVIIAPIGAGGMGEVYRARDTRLDREVAIKVLSERLANNPDALARFEREAKSVAALSHPNILAIHDVGHEQGISFVVTELLEGETLRERLRRSAVPWRKAVEYGIAIADGMAAAHAKGIIHRDIKPENIFLTKDGVVKILDFGLARVAPDANMPAELLADTPTMTLDTRPGTVLGTVNYMSPEQISGRATDARTDIFSFGCVLYELISGRRAFGGESVAEITTALLRDEPPTLSDSGQLVPVELDRVIVRCHEKKPELRIQSARDLSFAMRDLLSDSGPSKPAVAQHGLRSRTMLVVQLAVGVVAIVALLLALNVGGWRTPPISGLQRGVVSSLAVLPLENVSRDPEQEYFVDGMTEALISNLAKIGSIKVISRTSVMRYKATTKSLPEIARELNVDAVVEGSVLQVGDRVRITAQLIHAATDEHLWTESYDRELRDVLRLQSEVARTIAQEIKVTLTPQEQARMVERRPINPDAYQAYLKGRFYWNKRTRDGLQKAVECFEQAVALDPDWPLGYAGLADAYLLLPQFSFRRSSEAMPQAKAAAAKALEIDALLGDAHASLGHIATLYDWDWPAAEREFQRALELCPNYATAHYWYALNLAFTGRHDEALREITKAHQLDPLSLIVGNSVGSVHYRSGDLEKAETALRKTLELGPDFALAHTNLAKTLFLQGRSAEAITAAQESVRHGKDDSYYAATLGYICGKADQAEETRRILDQLTARSMDTYIPPTHFAILHAGLDERDRIFEWLERAYKERDTWLTFTLTDPLLSSLRSDPRFADLVRRLGLPPLNPIPPATSSSKPRSEKIMLAVLPFENLSHDPEQDYFSDGLTDEMIARMSRLNPKKLGVIARTSAMHYKNTAQTIEEIGRELRVAYVLEGSVRREGDRVQINAQLIQVSDQTQLWAESYERDLKDIFALQNEVAQRVAGSLAMELLPGVAASAHAGPINPEAYEAYLKGRFFWNKRTPDGLMKSLEYFEQAVALAPDWPLAYAGLADAHLLMPLFSSMRPSEAIPKARAAANRALELDDTLAEAHTTLAHIAAIYDWNFVAAEKEYERAIAINPNYSMAYNWYALFLMFTGRLDESIGKFTKAKELDPHSLVTRVNLARAFYYAGDLKQAETLVRESLELGSDFALAHLILPRILFLQGRVAEAISEAREAVRILPNDPHFTATLGFMCPEGGQPEEAREILDQLADQSAKAYVAPACFALVYAGLDQRDRMFEWLERAYQERDTLLIGTLTDPLLADMRSDPRFVDLVRRVGLPPLNPIPSATSSSKPHSEKIMLAVLPFENLSRDPEQEYFSDGLTDEMIAQVSRLNPKKLGVIARTSALHYKNSEKTIDAIGRELGVAYIVEGSVRKASDRVRITAKLIQVSDQTQLWAESYERNLKDIFDLQIDVAKRIAESLTVELLPGTAATAGRARPINPEAHEAYLKGRFHWNKRTPDGLKKAVDYFDQAIALDPDWPLGYAGLADAYSLLPEYTSMLVSETIPKAKVAAAKALELDESLAEAHATVALIAASYDWDWPTAEREYARALALSPNYAMAHHWYAEYLRHMGRHDESIREITKAQVLDPLSFIIAVNVGMEYYYAGDLEKSETSLRKTLELGPDFAHAHRILASTLFLQGRSAEAITQAREAFRLSNNDPAYAATLGQICAMGGQPEEARKILGELAARSTVEHVSPIHFASLYAGLDEKDRMFESLEESFQEREFLLLMRLTDPLLARMRSDPRFADLVRRVGLPEQK